MQNDNKWFSWQTELGECQKIIIKTTIDNNKEGNLITHETLHA